MFNDYMYCGMPIVTCEDCGVEMKLEVLMSGGGYYIGRECQCGSYSREYPEYFMTRVQAEDMLAAIKKLYNITY